MDPPSIPALAKKRRSEFKERMVGYATELKQRGVQDAYTARVFGVIKSWLKHNQVRFADDELFPVLAASRPVREEHVPTQEELRKVLAHLSSRGRVAALLMAHSGVRPGVIGHYDGTDGLRLRDLPELDTDTLEFVRHPFLIVVPEHLSKNHAGYRTFGGVELATAISTYLAERRDKFGERLNPDSPLVSVARQVRFTGGGGVEQLRYEPKFITELNLAAEIRTALKRVFPHDTPRPYCLRSYFSSQLFVAEGNHRVTATYREAWMGHTSSIDSVYNVRKGDHLVEQMRRAYAASEEFLSTQQKTAREVEARRVLDRVAAALGLSPDSLVERLGGNDATEPESQGDTPEEAPRPAKDSQAQGGGRHGLQVVRPLAELRVLIEQGYRFVQAIGPDGVFEAP